MKRKLTAGQTSVSLPIFIQDTSSTTGGGLSGLTSGTSGLVAEYRRRGQSSWTAITLTSKTLGTWTSGGFVADGALSGAYELDLPDAVCASGARWVAVRLRGATNMLPCLIEIELDVADYQVARLGASDGTNVTLAANQDVRNVSGSLPAVTLAASQPNYAPLTTLGTNAPAGWLNAAAFAAGSLNGKGDWATADALSTVSSTLQSMITALNNLSAKANWFGSLLLEVPDSGTRAYQFELVVRDDEDKLTNLDGNPTIALTNTAGTDRSSLITTPIANPSTGRYTLTISVGTSTVNEALKLTATGTISGETRYAVITPQVVDYDTATLINSIYTRIGAPAGASIAADIAATKTSADSAVTQATAAASSASSAASTASTINTKLGTPANITVSADIASIKTDTGTTIPGLFTTLTTKIRKFFQLLVRKDTAIATDNATELSELNANGGSGAGAYSQATDSLEAIRDRGDAAWTTGSGGGGSGDWTDDEKAAIRTILGIPGSGTTPADPTAGILDTIRDQVVANGVALSGTPIEPTSRIASGGSLTAYIGDDFRVRSGTELEIPVADVGGALYTKLNAIGAANLYFGASRSGKDAGAITGTVASLAQSGSGASQLLLITVEIANCGNGLQPADDYEYQIEQRQTQGSETDSFVEISGTLELKRKVV